jgi:hypothetical protein
MTRTTEQEPLSDLDRLALARAVEIERARNPACRQRIDRLAAEEGWLAAAQSAARHCQDIALHLSPWQCWPPSVVEPDETDEPGCEHRGITASAKLLRRMLRAGVSKYDPDPEAALQE